MPEMDWTLEVVIVPVSDLERAVEFYRDKVGFHLDHFTRNEYMQVAQLSPRGSIRTDITAAAAHSGTSNAGGNPRNRPVTIAPWTTKARNRSRHRAPPRGTGAR